MTAPDGRNSRTVGACWKCDRHGVEVLHVGDIAWSGIHVHLYACEDCVAHWHRRMWRESYQKDGAAARSPA